jgi:biopolymer transport protein ExbD
VKFRRQRRREPTIELINLVDVVVLILIFFMVATTFSKEGRMRLVLPEAEVAVSEEEAAPLELVVAETGEYALNGKVLINDRVESIVAALRAEAGNDFSQPLVITADAKVEHQRVVRAMDAAGRLGFSQLRISTRSPQAESEAGGETP